MKHYKMPCLVAGLILVGLSPSVRSQDKGRHHGHEIHRVLNQLSEKDRKSLHEHFKQLSEKDREKLHKHLMQLGEKDRKKLHKHLERIARKDH